MSFKLPDLPYERSDLEPRVSLRTMDFHHGKHHQTYVDNLNKQIAGTKFEGDTLETIVTESEGGIFNNAAQVWNHKFFFDSFSPSGGGHPQDELARAIERDFGSFDKFREEFSRAAVTLFGSGWAWLVKTSKGTLDIIQESNAGNPIRRGFSPVFTIDVWEHAYYLDYQNRRPEYVKALWEIVNWPLVSSRF